MASSPTKPEYIKLVPEQWAELMGKYDAMIHAIQGISITVPPADMSALTQAVKDLASLNVVLDHGYTRTDIFGEFEEYV